MSQDEGSCPKNEKNDMQLCSFIEMWSQNENGKNIQKHALACSRWDHNHNQIYICGYYTIGQLPNRQDLNDPKSGCNRKRQHISALDNNRGRLADGAIH
jgi:hypothetical protein